MPFLVQPCWQTRKLGVFTWDTILQLDSPHMSFVTYQDDNNQQDNNKVITANNIYI